MANFVLEIVVEVTAEGTLTNAGGNNVLLEPTDAFLELLPSLSRSLRQVFQQLCHNPRFWVPVLNDKDVDLEAIIENTERLA